MARNCGRSVSPQSTTSTVFVPGCRWMASITACSYRCNNSRSCRPARCRTHCLAHRVAPDEPLRYATISGRYSGARVNWPLACTVNAAMRPVQRARRQIHVRFCTAVLNFVDSDLPGRQRLRVELDPHRVLLRSRTPAPAPRPSPSRCAVPGASRRTGRRVERQRIRTQREIKNGLIRRIHLL